MFRSQNRSMLPILMGVCGFLAFQNCAPVGQEPNRFLSSAGRPWTGTKQFGAAGAISRSTQTTLDTFGNVYSVGNSTGRFDPAASVSAGVFITKFDKSGERVWSRMFGKDGFELEALGAAADTSNVYVVGWTSTGLEANVLNGNIDLFVAKFSNTGEKRWIRQYGTVGATAHGVKIAIDRSGDLIVVGHAMGQMEGAIAVGDQDLLIMKLDPAGNRKWVKQFGVMGKITVGNAVAVDGTNNIFVAGSTTGAFEGNAAVGTPDAIVMRVDANGNRAWSKQFGAPGSTTTASGIAVDQSGNVYFTGITSGALDGNTKTGVIDTFVGKLLAATGSRTWFRQTGLAGTTAEAYGIAADRTSNVYLTGCNLGDPATTFRVGYLIKYDTHGVRGFTDQPQIPNADVCGTAVEADFTLNIFVGGFTAGALTGAGKVGVVDSFIMKFNAQGAKY